MRVFSFSAYHVSRVAVPFLLYLVFIDGTSRYMHDWGFWEWLAYGVTYVGAIILALETAVSVSPSVQSRLPDFLEARAWGFLPAALLTIGAIVFLLRASGLIQEENSTAITAECMTYYGESLVPDGKTLEVHANGNCFKGMDANKYVAAAALHWDGVKDINDTEIELKSSPRDIIDGEILIKIPLQQTFAQEVASGERRTNYFLLLVPSKINMSQFTTLRQAKELGVAIVSARGGPP